MKKVYCAVLVLVLLAVCVSACANDFNATEFFTNYAQYVEMLGVPGLTTDYDIQTIEGSLLELHYCTYD